MRRSQSAANGEFAAMAAGRMSQITHTNDENQSSVRQLSPHFIGGALSPAHLKKP